jgi:hypothetical protein
MQNDFPDFVGQTALKILHRLNFFIPIVEITAALRMHFAPEEVYRVVS